MTETIGATPARRFFALAVIAAPVVFLLGDVAYISDGNGINNGVLGGTIGVWSSFLLGWAFIAISRALEPVASRGAVVLLVLGIPAICAGVAFNVNGLHWDHFGNDFVDAAFSDGGPTVGALAFLPWGWFMPASLVVAGVLVWRTRMFPRWAGAMTALSGVLFVTARPASIDALAITADVVMVVGLAPIGLAMLTGAVRRAPDRNAALV